MTTAQQINDLCNKILAQKTAAVDTASLQGTAGQVAPQPMPPGQPAPMPGQPMPQGGMPVDPATGMPVDPATGMPIDPATGMPMDPAAAGAAPPMDPAQDPLVIIEEHFKAAEKRDQEIIKMLGQVRTLVATLVDVSGVQVPTDRILAAGEDVVKDTAEKATVAGSESQSKEAMSEHEDGDASDFPVNTIMSEVDEGDRSDEIQQNAHVIGRKASSIIRRFM